MICCSFSNGGLGAVIHGFCSASLQQILLADNLQSGATVIAADTCNGSSGGIVMLNEAVIAAGHPQSSREHGLSVPDDSLSIQHAQDPQLEEVGW